MSLVHLYGYPTVALILFLDSAGVPWPAEVTLIAFGVAAAAGKQNILLIYACALVGAGIGCSLSYYLGHRIGPRLMQRIGRIFRLTPEHMAKVDEWFNKHGHRAVFLGRFVPFVRSLCGYPAGVIGMPFGKYLIFSLAGYGLYTAFALTLGFGGTTLTHWIGDLQVILWIATPLTLLVVYLKWGRRWANRQRGKG